MTYPQKIAMVSIAVGDKFRESVAPCIQSHADYAKRHGYRYFQPRGIDTEGRPPSWGKIIALRQLMKENPQIDYFFWIDADALITNPHLRLEPLCLKLEKSKRQFLISVDGGGNMNLGVFMVRRGEIAEAEQHAKSWGFSIAEVRRRMWRPTMCVLNETMAPAASL